MRQDAHWMAEAVALARRGEGRTRPNPPVGAVVVRKDRCVGRGWHRKAGGPHAEVAAIEEAGQRARGATLYVSLEPCCTQGRTGPCTQAIVHAGIRRVVTGTRDPNPRHRGRGHAVLRRSGIQVTTRVGHEAAEALIAPFAHWLQTGRPYVTLKMGMTLDGRIADDRGRSRWITGAASRRRVRDLRGRVDGILVGAGTALVDDPELLPAAGRRKPYRIIVDSSGRLPLTAAVLSDAHVERTILATTHRCSVRRRAAYEAAGATVCLCRGCRGEVSVASLLEQLGRRGLLHVLCEGGGRLAGSLVRGRCVNRFLFFIAGRVLGSGVPVVETAGWPLARAPRLRFIGEERVGEDLLVRAEPWERK